MLKLFLVGNVAFFEKLYLIIAGFIALPSLAFLYEKAPFPPEIRNFTDKSKKFVLVLLIFCVSGYAKTAFSEEDNATKFIETLAKVKRTTYVYKKPSTKSRRLRKIYMGSKVIVIQDYDDNWYKVKYNNVRSGYVLKKYLELTSTLKKEVRRGSYRIKKLEIDLKSFIQRFNFNMKESRFYLDSGFAPLFKLRRVVKIDKNTLRVELIYYWDIKKGVKVEDRENPFRDVLKKFIEVVFFKMFVIEGKYYEVYLYDKNNKLYAKFRYTELDDRFKEIKDIDGKIWEYIECDRDIDKLFEKIDVGEKQ